MADHEEHHHPHSQQASANIKSASSGSISQLNVHVSDLDGTFNPSGHPPSTTTISTIAVQAGEARIVLAVLRSSDVARVRIQQMEPDLMDIGSNLNDIIQHQTVHEELISKLKAKQDNITELLTRADDLVTQQKSYNEVYEAMARSLGDAWKELNLQLEGRRNLLNQARRYHEAANRFDDRVNEARSWFHSLEQANFDNKPLDILFDDHDRFRKETLEASLETLNEGQSLLEHVKELGSLIESISPHAATAACYEIEHLLGTHQDERQKFEDEWDRNRKILNDYVQMAEIKRDIDQIFDWLEKQSHSYADDVDLGQSLDDIERLQSIHKDIETQSQTIHDQVLRCMHAVDAWIFTGLTRADRLHAHAHTLLVLWEKWALKLDIRRRLLQLSHRFYIDSSNAFSILDKLEDHLRNVSLNSSYSSDDLTREFNQINEELVQSIDIPLREGRILIEKMKINDYKSSMLHERVCDLEKRAEQLRNLLLNEYEKINQYGSLLYQTFDKECTAMQSWLFGVLEHFLNSNRCLIDSNNENDIRKQANDFLESHQFIIERDLKQREEDIHRLGTLVHELQASNDRHWQMARTRSDNLFVVWQKLSDILIRRHTLAQSYRDFQNQIEQFLNDLTGIDDVIRYRENIDLLPESAVKHIEETWSNLRNNYHDIISISKRIRHALETEAEQLGLQTSDTHRTMFNQCEQLTRRFEQMSSMFDLWIQKLESLRDFKIQWEQFLDEARRTIDQVYRSELTIAPTQILMTDGVEKYQYILNDFGNRVQETTREVEDHIRTAEQLGMRGETNGQKEQIINELVKAHQQYLSRSNQTRSFLNIVINYYKNISKLETQFINNEQMVQSLPSDIRSTEVLVRQYEDDREKLIQTFEQCRHDVQLADSKAKQCGISSFIEEIFSKQNDIDSRYFQWQQRYEENRSRLNQRVEWCQFLDEKYKIVYEMDSLQKEIEKRKRNIPQTYKEALSRNETSHEINRLYENCERAVQRFRTTAEIMLQQKHPEYQQVENEVKDVENKLSSISISIGNYRQHVDKITVYYRLIDEIERWHQESSLLLVQIGTDIIHCQDEHDAKQLLDQVSMAIDQGKIYEQEKMKHISALAFEVFGVDDGQHRLKNVTAKNIELINAFIKVHQDISTVQRNFEHHQDYLKDNTTMNKQLPVFAKPLRDTTINEGTRFTFECLVQGSEPIDIAWFKNQKSISSLTHDIQYDRSLATLTFMDVKKEDSAYYTCRASNSAGTAESSAYLVIKVEPSSIIADNRYHQYQHAPTFIEPLRSYDVAIDSTVAFECIIYGEPMPIVTWEHDSIELCKGHSLSDATSKYKLYRLTLEHVRLSDSGEYACKATNHCGEATSVADLIVYSNQQQQQQQQQQNDMPISTEYEPRLTEPLKTSYIVREGQSVKLSCRFDANPRGVTQWLKDGIPIDREALEISRDFKIVKEIDYTALLIKKAFPEDTGSYTVIIQNPLGETRSFTQLIVEEFFCRTPESEMSDTPCKPIFVQPLRNITVNEGQKLKLHAAINAHPEPEIIWYCNNIPLKSSSDLKLTFDGQLCTLVKDRCEKENDDGLYRITAVNSMGQAESTCQVMVQSKDAPIFNERLQSMRSPPTILQSLTNQIAHEGERIIFGVRIIGHPKPQIVWYKDNQPLRNTHDHKIRNQDDVYTLEIPELFMDDAGVYMVKAINIEGEVKCECLLNVLHSVTNMVTDTEQINVPPNGFPPEFLQLFTDRQTSVNTTIVFEARIVGTQPLNVYWLFNGFPLSNIDNSQRCQQQVFQDTYSLTVHDVRYEDAGRYTLNAENAWGKATCTAELFVPPTKTPIEMSPSPPLPRKRHIETGQQQTSSTNTRSYEQEYEQQEESAFISSNTNKRYRPLQSSLERTHSLSREDEYRRRQRQYPKSIDVFIPYNVLERERNQQGAKTSTTTRSYEYEVEERRRASSMSGKQQRKNEFDEEREYLECLRDLTNEYEKSKRQKKSSDNRNKKTTIDTQEEYESVEEVYQQQRPVATTTTTTTEEVIQRSTYRMPTTATSSSVTRLNQFEKQFVDNFSVRPQVEQHSTVSFTARNDGEQRLTTEHRSFSEELLYKRLIPTAKQLYTATTSAATSEAGFATSDDDLTTMEYRLKRKERLKPIRIYSSTSSIPGETSVKYVRTEPQPVQVLVPKPQIITTQGEHSTTIVKDVRRTTGKITTNIQQQHQRTTIEGEHELRIIKEPISAGQTQTVEFTVPKPIETAPAEHSSTFVVESKKGGRYQTLDISSALEREHTLTGEHELRVISEPISSGLHNKAVEFLFPKPPVPPPPSHHSSTIVKQTRAPPSTVVFDNIQTTLKGEHELRLLDHPIESGAIDSVELIVPKSITETAEHTTTIVTETQPQRRVLEITGSGRKMESEHETKFFRDAVRVEEEIEVKLPKQHVEMPEHTTTIIKHSRGKGPIIEVDTTQRLIEGEHETRIIERSIEAQADAMQLLVAKPQLSAEHSTTVVKEQRGKPQVYAIDRTQPIPGEHETKYYEKPIEAFGEMHVLFPKHQPVIGPLEGEHMSTLVKQVHGKQIIYDGHLREIPGEHSLTVVDSSSAKLDKTVDSEVEFIVPKPRRKRIEEHSTTVLKTLARRPLSSSDYDEVFASSAGEEEYLRRHRYQEEEESGWTSAGEHSTTYVRQARAKFEPVELVVDKPKLLPSVSTLIADIQAPTQITSIRPATVLIPQDSSVKLDMELNSQSQQQQYDEMELVLEKPLVLESSTKLIANVQPGLEIKSFRPTTDIQQQKVTEESSSSLTMQMQQQVEEEALELRIRKPHVQDSSSVVIANIEPELGIQGQLKPSPYIPPPIEESSTALTMDLNADQPTAPFELIIPRIGIESSTTTVLAQVAPAIAGIRAKVDVPQVEKSTSKFVLEQKKRLDEEVELIMPKPKRIETSTSTMIADVEAKLETKSIRASEIKPEKSTSTFYLDETAQHVIPEPVEIRMNKPVIADSSTTVLANVKATLDTQQIKVLGNPYQSVEESSSAIILDTVSEQLQPSEVELILPRPHIQESKSVVFADVRPTLDTSQTHIVIPPPMQYPVKSSSQLILQADEMKAAPVELHLHRQPSSHTLVAKLDDKRVKTKDTYILNAGYNQEQQYGTVVRDSSSTLYTDLSRPYELKADAGYRRQDSNSKLTAKERMTMSSSTSFGPSDNSTTLITEIESHQLEPVEFIVSGSLTGNNNVLEPYRGSGTSNLATKRTMSSSNTNHYSERTNSNSSQSYPPYFIVSLRDQTVKEGESVLFEIVVSALPLAEIIWDKDGEIINVDSALRIDYYSDGRATLYIPETFLDDQGYYTCTARNALGSCRTTARLIIKPMSDRISPARRRVNSSSAASPLQQRRPFDKPNQASTPYRAYTHSEPPPQTYKESPPKFVTQVTEETEVIHIPPQQLQQEQHSEITYTVQDRKPKLEPVSFQVSTMKEKAKPRPPPSPTTPTKDDGNDPNPFKIFGAKLRSRPIQGIVPSYDN